MAPKVAHALKRRNANTTSCGKKYFANLMKLRNDSTHQAVLGASQEHGLGRPRGEEGSVWTEELSLGRLGGPSEGPRLEAPPTPARHRSSASLSSQRIPEAPAQHPERPCTQEPGMGPGLGGSLENRLLLQKSRDEQPWEVQPPTSRKIPRVSTLAPSLAACEAETVTLFHCGSEGVSAGSHLLPEAFPDSTSPCCPGKALTLDRHTSWWLDPTCDGPALCGAWPAGLPPLPSSPPAPDPGDSGLGRSPHSRRGPRPCPRPCGLHGCGRHYPLPGQRAALSPRASGKVSERPAPQPAARRGARVRLLRGRPAACQRGLTPRSHPEPHLGASVWYMVLISRTPKWDAMQRFRLRLSRRVTFTR
uniref:uncharacterized protein LOC129505883 n=1 Tax=Nyctereutes procyonoides TaxID=34880 RepID=UPI00244382A8|nr:uncharacterized protein LOC129505883 [Nyctereutes procyonoides]